MREGFFPQGFPLVTVAVAIPARRRNHGRQAVDQFERRQHQADATTRPRFDAFVDQMFGVDFSLSLQGRSRPGAVAQQAFQTLPVRWKTVLPDSH